MSWEGLTPIERAVLCSLWKQAPKAWKANIPPEALLRGLHPKLRNKTLVYKALKTLIKKGLASWYPARKGKTVTITPTGKQLARLHCIEDWEKIRRGEG